MQNQEIKVEALQETNLNDKATIKAPMGYSIITEKLPKDRGKGGGLVFIIKDCVPFHTLKLSKPNGDIHIEQQAIEIETGKKQHKDHQHIHPSNFQLHDRFFTITQPPTHSRRLHNCWRLQCP